SDAESHELMRRAAEAQRANRAAEAATLYRQVLQHQRSHLAALRALRDIAGEARQWAEALELQHRIIGLAAPTERARESEGLAVALGRVYFELEMLDEAADQFEKVEVRAPDLPVVHAFLGAVFERRGETRQALDEYRRALGLGHGFTWPHRCAACGADAPGW